MSIPPYEFLERNFKSDHEILEMLRLRTSMYTGENSLCSIDIYLSAYQTARLDCQHAQSDALDFFTFNDYVTAQLGFSENTAGWANMILVWTVNGDASKLDVELVKRTASEEDHRASIKKFYQLLDAFRALET